MENKQEILDKLLPALQATRRRVMKKYNRKSPRERQLRTGAQRKTITININDPGADYKREDDRYFRLWVLLKERIARKVYTGIPEKEKYIYIQLMTEMAILEADEILED